MYALYDKPDAPAAEAEANMIIRRFINDMEKWGEKYQHVGADDTASREAFAIQTAKALGLRKYLDHKE